MDKARLRETFCGIREGMREAGVAERSAVLCRRLAKMPQLRAADMVLAYMAFRNELDVSPLFDLLPEASWVLPRIEVERLILHPCDLERLIPHPYGMLEPPSDSPLVDPEQVDLALVPGVCFDRRGARVGFGGGFYDRLLIQTSAIRVGVCDDHCLVEEVPCAEHDQRMDWVVTPTVAIHCAPLWRRIGGEQNRLAVIDG